MSKILVTKKNHITTITINRPEQKNCIDQESAELLMEAWLDFRDDDEQFVAILTGAGDTFCAGADLKNYVSQAKRIPWSKNKLRRFIYNGTGYMGYTRQTDIFKPIIGAINGGAFAGGLELACLADFRIASETSEFGVLCRRWNVPLVDGGTQRLPHIVGLGNAMELIIRGKRIEAKEAYRIGLVNEIVPASELMTRVYEIAEEICAFPQAAIRTDKQAVLNGLGTSLDEGLRIEAQLGQYALGSSDMEEGLRAFTEKRKPSFKQED
ncbi:MAG: enoyl-CoA hydratase/isomerase family protein [Acidobacteria bacterium]|nr:enoyl-CoA hydratase/isomerase family protein [Acidobacteriota bacterium]